MTNDTPETKIWIKMLNMVFLFQNNLFLTFCQWGSLLKTVSEDSCGFPIFLMPPQDIISATLSSVMCWFNLLDITAD